MKSPSSQINELIIELARKAASSERERCAKLVEALQDGTDDPVVGGILGEVVTAIRRLTDVQL